MFSFPLPSLIVCLFSLDSATDRTLELSPTESSLLLSLCDLLSFFCANHGHRSQYFILSGTLNTKIGSLLRARDKPLRHGESEVE